MGKAFRLRDGSWALGVGLEDPRIAATLESCPGAFLNFTTGQITGRIDAIAAVCLRLNRQADAPPRPRPWEFSSPLDLRDYQTAGVAGVLGIVDTYGGALLADDVGLGKTRQGIAAALALGGRVMIATTAATRETWRDELAKCGFADTVAILAPVATKADQAEWDKAPLARFVVTSYHHDVFARAWEAAAFSHQPPNVLLMDEVHRLRGRGALRAKTVAEASTMTRYRIGMTGTPMWDRPRDLFKVLQILLGSYFNNPWQFDRAYCGGHINEHGGWENKGATLRDELRLRLSYYMVRRLKQDVMKELPPLTRQIVWLDPVREATAEFKAAVLKRDSGATMRALEACLEAKMEAACDLAEEAKRFLLFTYLRAHAERLTHMLNKRGVKTVCITGAQSPATRAEMARLAIAKGAGLVATLDSMGEGVNIQGVASTGIMHAFPYEPIKIVQGEGRLHRQGQTGNVHWQYVGLRESMDALVLNKIVSKLGDQRDVVGRHGDPASSLRNALGAETTDVEAQKRALRALYEDMK